MKYKEWLKPENLILIEGWAREGLTNKEITGKMGISEDTFYNWQKKYSEFSEALKKGKEVVDFLVEKALLQNCLANENVAAQIFWLCNRMPDKWSNKPLPNNKEVMKKIDSILGGIDAIANE